MDEEQRPRGDQEEQLRATTEELEKAKAQIRGPKEELTRAKEYMAIMANIGQNTSVDTEPVVSANIHNAIPEPAPAVTIALKAGTEKAQELVALRDELAT